MSDNTVNQVSENEKRKLNPINIVITLIVCILISIIIFKANEKVSEKIVHESLIYDEFKVYDVTLVDNKYSWSLKAEETDGNDIGATDYTVYNAECTLVNNRLSYTYEHGDEESTTISIDISDETRDRIIKDLEDKDAEDIYTILVSRAIILRR